MKLTKYEHACMVIEEAGKRLVIDPGGFTTSFGSLESIAAVVVTHAHADHFSTEHLQAIFSANPHAPLFTTKDVAEQFQQPNVIVVSDGQTETIGPFTLIFSGELHARISQNTPKLYNTAVRVNDVFFYPGDSYTIPKLPVDVLAVPANAPWMRVEESMEFITQTKPKRCFPTHNGLLSEAGNAVYNGALQYAADAADVQFIFLKPGDSLKF
jgi:L-ascorbate metabolism protein UlaG (beta-lactamase superfamily)